MAGGLLAGQRRGQALPPANSITLFLSPIDCLECRAIPEACYFFMPDAAYFVWTVDFGARSARAS